MYDYSKLKGKIREVYGTQELFAKALGIGNATLNLKLNNKSEWTQEEMIRAMQLLEEEAPQIPAYFFTK